jgi:hypothetical protein
LKTSSQDATPTIPRDSRESDPSALEREHARGTANPAEARRVDSGVDTDGIDLARAIALAVAIEPFVQGEVRPLARELVALLRTAHPGAELVSLLERRRTRK